ncbi:MAG: hypothetical protein H6853_05540 [Rhodospirillales bacterium]|nr:hypothetical protein [Alphaproteobacteria bacterium]USO03012.1 MAG: hypothetical protein H6853_05540 [Rhodospirillales bacterium]
MFGKILDVGTHRTTMEAVWFYILSLVLLVGLSTTMVHFLGMVGVVDGVGTFFGGGEIHTLIGSIFVLMLSGLILSSRKMTSDIFAVLVAAVGIYLAYTTSVMIGLVPVALLTTLKK